MCVKITCLQSQYHMLQSRCSAPSSADHMLLLLLLSSSVLNAQTSLYVLRLLTQDGIIETVKRKRYFEKPCRERQRRSYESCKRIYNTEMARKVAFISRTSRQDPWLGC